MFNNEKKVEDNEKKFFDLQSTINRRLEATNNYYNLGDKYYKDYSDFITKLASTFDSLKAHCDSTLTSVVGKQEEARSRSATDDEYARRAEENINLKTQEFTAKRQLFEEARGKLGGALQGLDSKKLAKLKVKGQVEIETFFGNFYKVFYPEATEAFSWEKFKKDFEKDKLKDFSARLSAPKFDSITENQFNLLLRLKEDKFYTEYAKNPKEGISIAPLLAYLESFVTAYRENFHAIALQGEIDTIRSDAPRRAENAKNDANLAGELSGNVAYLRDLKNRIQKSADPFKAENDRKNAASKDYEQHKTALKQTIQNDYAGIQYVPHTVFASS